MNNDFTMAHDEWVDKLNIVATHASSLANTPEEFLHSMRTGVVFNEGTDNEKVYKYTISNEETFLKTYWSK